MYLSKKPDIFVFNEDQSIVFIAAKEDVFFIDFDKDDTEVDIDNTYNISDIRACHYHDGKFYVLANKFQQNRGIFLLKIDEENLADLSKKDFVIKWSNLLEIGDADIFIIEDRTK